jgi:hypothetical protein
VGDPAFAPPGEEDFLVADLEPGDYIVLCTVPVGPTSTDGPPHAMQGMVAELTIA